MSGVKTSLPYDRAFNFSAGPGALPVEVLEQVRDEVMNYGGTGVSIMEMSHRSKAFEAVVDNAIADIKALMGIPDNYRVLFLQGGASLQFTMVPMNLRRTGESIDLAVTGSWGKKAVEAAKLDGGQAQVIFDAKGTNYDHAPRLAELTRHDGAAYTHFTSNETIQGVDYLHDPDGTGMWICDMSSNILSRKVDVSKYALIYAGAQKNIGPAGATLVIMREDLLERIPEGLPPMLDYRIHAENNSLYNTPPCWSIYVCGLVFKHVLKMGGVPKMEELNERKAALLYDLIDSSDFYSGHAQKQSRSRMNVTFTLPTDELTTAFISGAKEQRMLELKGHRSVGGCRASIYNAVPIEAVTALTEYMREFEAKHG